MLKLENIVGAATEPFIADRLHDLGHHGRVEYLTLSQEDTHRHRLRAATDAGTECAVILDRTAHLYNGAVLMLTEERAVVVRMRETEWLTYRDELIARHRRKYTLVPLLEKLN